MRIPDKLINFMIYKNGKRQGVADVELPNIEYMTETLSGAGIMGETETPALGQISSMSTTLNFRAPDINMGDFIEPQGNLLECRGAIQEWDSGNTKIKPVGVTVIMQAIPKSLGIGKFEVASRTDTSAELELTYLKMYVDNKLICEIDKLNFICIINGKDYLEEVRQQLGL